MTTTHIWKPPSWLYDDLHEVFRFDKSLVAFPENPEFGEGYENQADCLEMEWSGNVWCNPPFNHGWANWVDKAWSEYQAGRVRAAMLLIPAVIEAPVWGDIVFPYARAICFPNRRVRFTIDDKVIGTPTIRNALVFFAAVITEDQVAALKRIGGVVVK